MSRELPYKLAAEYASRLGFTKRDFDRFAARARRLRANLGAMEDEISEEALVHEKLLGELTRNLLAASGEVAETDLKLSLDVLAMALKAHGEWRELITPIARKLGDQLAAQKKKKVDARQRLAGGALDAKLVGSGSTEPPR